METSARPATPALHWVIAAAAILWNAIGPTDYLMSKTRNDAYFEAMMPGVDPQLLYDYADAFPLLVQIGWVIVDNFQESVPD